MFQIYLTQSLLKTIITPFERVKLILQTQNNFLNNNLESKPIGTIECFKLLKKKENLSGFFKANNLSLIRQFSLPILNQIINGLLNVIQQKTSNNKFVNKFSKSMNSISSLIGGFSGYISITILYPLDTLITLLITDFSIHSNSDSDSDLKYKSILNCINLVYNQGGLTNFYRGLIITLFSSFIYNLVFHYFYTKVQNLSRNLFGKNLLIDFISSFCVSCSIGFIIYPLDTIRRRLIVDSVNKFTTFTLIQHMFVKEGINSFFAGFKVNCLRLLCFPFINFSINLIEIFFSLSNVINQQIKNIR
eukprot:TRINITY_DN2959_c0_g1_i1.p1 TRINITY_DN2959_c0_g1~~TRINITY_DN2959_c0_g1_i1.p1  ORF type:complete len:304 (-),score=99.63 TRINITY_DN2959_c0_g1_i1:32-943(-)